MRQPHKYRGLSPDEIENVFSHYLLNSWSYSKVESFARNEKAFEMSYVYNIPFRIGASGIAGESYHDAVKHYFTEYQQGIVPDLIEMQQKGFDYIDKVKPNKWKLSKGNPTIADCVKDANADVVKLLNNFMNEVSVYKLEGSEILAVEIYCNQFITVNGVDIPLPCHMKIDLIIKTKEGKIVIIDHKSKAKYTSEEELRFSIGKQAITYVLGYEAEMDIKVDEVWFVENKASKNSDESPQLHCFEVIINEDTRRLYEALLYEPLKCMLEAVADPDHTYIINEADNYVDKAELYEFWARTQIAEIGDFINIPDNKVDLIKKRLKKIRDASVPTITPTVIKKFREEASKFIKFDMTNKNMSNSEKIEHTLRQLGSNVSVAHVIKGYSSDTYLLEASANAKIASISKYRLDIASSLNVENVRIGKELYVYQGKAYLPVEASKFRETDLLFDPAFLVDRKIPLGFDNFGNKIIWDMDNSSTPHVLIGGTTGSGKSVQLIVMLAYAKLAGVSRIIILDPKFEFVSYNIPGVQVINEIAEIEDKLELIVEEMNSFIQQGKKTDTLIIFDEFADAVLRAKKGKLLNVYENVQVGQYDNGRPKMERQNVGTKNSLPENLQILLQKGRSVGYRVVAAAQRASTKVINGDTKVNFPVQICFQVQKKVDSLVILDEEGAEGLSGKGDALIKSPEYRTLTRFQSLYKRA